MLEPKSSHGRFAPAAPPASPMLLLFGAAPNQPDAVLLHHKVTTEAQETRPWRVGKVCTWYILCTQSPIRTGSSCRDKRLPTSRSIAYRTRSKTNKVAVCEERCSPGPMLPILPGTAVDRAAQTTG
jgi:hypothetical protein